MVSDVTNSVPSVLSVYPPACPDRHPFLVPGAVACLDGSLIRMLVPMLLLLPPLRMFDSSDCVSWGPVLFLWRLISKSEVAFGFVAPIMILARLQQMHVDILLDVLYYPLTEPMKNMPLALLIHLFSIPIDANIGMRTGTRMNYLTSTVVNVIDGSHSVGRSSEARIHSVERQQTLILVGEGEVASSSANERQLGSFHGGPISTTVTSTAGTASTTTTHTAGTTTTMATNTAGSKSTTSASTAGTTTATATNTAGKKFTTTTSMAGSVWDYEEEELLKYESGRSDRSNADFDGPLRGMENMMAEGKDLYNDDGLAVGLAPQLTAAQTIESILQEMHEIRLKYGYISSAVPNTIYVPWSDPSELGTNVVEQNTIYVPWSDPSELGTNVVESLSMFIGVPQQIFGCFCESKPFLHHMSPFLTMTRLLKGTVYVPWSDPADLGSPSMFLGVPQQIFGCFCESKPFLHHMSPFLTMTRLLQVYVPWSDPADLGANAINNVSSKLQELLPDFRVLDTTVTVYVPWSDPSELGVNVVEQVKANLERCLPDYRVLGTTVRKGSLILTFDLIYVGASSNLDPLECIQSTVASQSWVQWLDLPWPKDGEEVMVQVGDQHAVGVSWDFTAQQWAVGKVNTVGPPLLPVLCLPKSMEPIQLTICVKSEALCLPKITEPIQALCLPKSMEPIQLIIGVKSEVVTNLLKPNSAVLPKSTEPIQVTIGVKSEVVTDLLNPNSNLRPPPPQGAVLPKSMEPIQGKIGYTPADIAAKLSHTREKKPPSEARGRVTFKKGTVRCTSPLTSGLFRATSFSHALQKTVSMHFENGVGPATFSMHFKKGVVPASDNMHFENGVLVQQCS
eukprot:gene21489-28465_t